MQIEAPGIKTSLYLLLAILLEVAGTTSMKLSEGFIYFTPSLLIFIFYIFSFIFLILSLKKLEVGLAYAIWSGLGTLLIALLGAWFFNEPVNFLKGLSLLSIGVGVVGLRMS